MNPQVEKTENAVAAALKGKKQEPTKYPERPGYGTRGRPIMVFANYFELKSVGPELLRYHVDIAGDSSGKKPTGRKARQIVSLLIDEHFGQAKRNIASDYRSTLIANANLLEGDQAQYDVRYRDEHDDEYPADAKVYRVTIQFTGRLNPSDLLAYLTSTNPAAAYGAKPDTVQALNIVLGHEPKTSRDIASVGANKHYAIGNLKEDYDLTAGLVALRGYFVSVRAATARLLVNVQVKYVACYQQGSLRALIDQYGTRDMHGLGRFLKKLRVEVTHITRKNKKGQKVPRFKTITHLATTADGASMHMRPKVSRFGAGPTEVQFFLDAPGQPSTGQSSSATPKGKGGKKPAKAGPPPPGRYISVAEFFKQRKF